MLLFGHRSHFKVIKMQITATVYNPKMKTYHQFFLLCFQVSLFLIYLLNSFFFFFGVFLHLFTDFKYTWSE